MENNTNNTSACTLSGDLSYIEVITGEITYGNGSGETIPLYNGEYEVNPLALQNVVLPTRGKKMTDDITINQIPYYEAINPSGGTTVYIATNIENG